MRDLGDDGRDDFERLLSELLPTLAKYPRRRFQLGITAPIQFWLCRPGSTPEPAEVRRQGEIACLVVDAANIPVVVATLASAASITGLQLTWVKAPSVLQLDYPELKAEAEHARSRSIDLSGAGG